MQDILKHLQGALGRDEVKGLKASPAWRVVRVRYSCRPGYDTAEGLFSSCCPEGRRFY